MANLVKPSLSRMCFGILAIASAVLVLSACTGPWMHGGYHHRGYDDTHDDRRLPPPDPRYRQEVPAPGWGPVTDKEQAEAVVRDMLIESRNPNLKVGRVADKGPYFEVEIVTRSNSLVDIMLVDKETGRMRSAYR